MATPSLEKPVTYMFAMNKMDGEQNEKFTFDIMKPLTLTLHNKTLKIHICSWHTIWYQTKWAISLSK